MKLNGVILASQFCQWPTPVFDNGFWVYYCFWISGYNIKNLQCGQTVSCKTHLIGTAYTADGDTRVTLWAINNIFIHLKKWKIGTS